MPRGTNEALRHDKKLLLHGGSSYFCMGAGCPCIKQFQSDRRLCLRLNPYATTMVKPRELAVQASASRTLSIVSKRDPENSPKYSEFLNLRGKQWSKLSYVYVPPIRNRPQVVALPPNNASNTLHSECEHCGGFVAHLYLATRAAVRPVSVNTMMSFAEHFSATRTEDDAIASSFDRKDMWILASSPAPCRSASTHAK